MTKRPPNPTWFQASGPDTVLSSEALRETFDRAQEHVRRYFSKFVADPATGRIEINDDRYVLVRASALSTDFFDTVTQHYDDRDPGEAAAIARSFLFDIAHTIGKNDARAFHAKVVIDDPIDRLCTGPVCFAYSGWALVDIGDALPMPGDDDYLLTYDHPYSFEADSWLRKGRTSDTPVCVMNAGYSAGWSEESFGIALTAVEVKCRARGDDACTFVMAPPHRIHDHLRELYPERAAAGAPIPFERKSEEDALRRSERRLRSILAATPMPVLITREDGTLLYGNEHAHHVFGLAADHTTQVSALFERDGALDELLRANRDGERILGVEHRMLDAAGEPFSALVSCHGILLPDGESGMVVTALDVTDYKRTEAALRVNERMATVGTLAAGVAHEINNPLSYVIANLERLAGQARRGEVDPAAIDRALEGALRVRDIVRDLRSLSRDRPAEVDEAVDVEAVLDSAIAMASVEWRHRAEMVRDYAGLPPIRGNGGRIGQVFLNLLVNAAQAIVEGAASTNRITATTRCDGDRVSVEIADTGAGIAAAELSRIFDPFFTTKGVGEGTGLGLTITRNIVSELGGEIRAESEPGRGTAVTVTLPASPPPDRAGADLDDEPVDLDNLRILIVDDEEPLTDVLVEMLDECAVTVATSGRAARARLGETCFDVVLCDLMMPDVTGMELYRTVPVEVRDRIIFMTGGAFTSSAASFLDTIDNLCLEKPIELRVLRRAIHSHVSGQRG